MASILPFTMSSYQSGQTSDDVQTSLAGLPPVDGGIASAERSVVLVPLLTALHKAGIGAVTEPLPNYFTGNGAMMPSYDGDYHYRLIITPTSMRLINPKLGSDIPFYLWNTFPVPESIQEVSVDGSEVLSFDVNIGDQILDSQYLKINMEIGAGEPNVEAVVRITTDDGFALLNVVATISDTFNLIPEVPVSEEWNYLTDVIQSRDQSEQRISLRNSPRVTQNYDVQIIDMRQRREQYNLLKKNIIVQSLIPFYQYATPPTKVSSLGSSRIYFDPQRTNMREGNFLIIVNPGSEDIMISKIVTLFSDGAELNTALTSDVGPTWIVVPSLLCIMEDGTGLKMNNVSGSLTINASSYEDPEVLRPGQDTVIEYLDGMPIVKFRPLIPADESFSFNREIIDTEVGKREVFGLGAHAIVSGTRSFTIQRGSRPEEMDWWREFADATRGAWKPYLLSTYFPDFTLGKEMEMGSSTVVVQQTDYAATYFQYEAWKRIQFEWDNHELTNHTVTSAVDLGNGTAQLTFTPGLPSDPKYTNPQRISYLLKCRGTDNIKLQHYADFSEISIGMVLTDEG